MSAFVCAPATFKKLTRAGLAFGYGGKLAWSHGGELRRDDSDTWQQTIAMLYRHNVASVNYRYDEAAAFEDGCPTFTAGDFMRAPVTPVEVLKLLDCFEYQACEPPTWETSEAKSFCDALRRDAIRQLDGYEAAPWG